MQCSLNHLLKLNEVVSYLTVEINDQTVGVIEHFYSTDRLVSEDCSTSSEWLAVEVVWRDVRQDMACHFLLAAIIGDWWFHKKNHFIG
jgi:hypothetical protein